MGEVGGRGFSQKSRLGDVVGLRGVNLDVIQIDGRRVRPAKDNLAVVANGSQRRWGARRRHGSQNLIRCAEDFGLTPGDGNAVHLEVVFAALRDRLNFELLFVNFGRLPVGHITGI